MDIRAASDLSPDRSLPVLAAHGVSHRFGTRLALDNVSFALATGRSAAVIGPNGAGKTTLLSILGGSLAPTAGSVTRPSGRGAVGWVPQEAALYAKLTVAENLALFAHLEGVADVRATVRRMLDQTRLAERAADRVGDLSGGGRQRVNIAIGLLAHPVVLLLDEPGASLDPWQRMRLWEFIGELTADGTSVVYSTHDLDEARRHADTVLALEDGRLVHSGPAIEFDWTVG
ncbi:MAG: ABC transporter ATP-binding protein [Solirubrobacteraceae bacterium]